MHFFAAGRGGPANERLKLTGAAILVFRAFNVLAGGPGTLAERCLGPIDLCEQPNSRACSGPTRPLSVTSWRGSKLHA
jgi:hypothetical protein